MTSPDRHQLVVFNDDVHSYRYVIELFERQLGHPRELAFRLACEIDAAGQAVVFVGTLEEVEEVSRAILEGGPDPAVPRSRGPLRVTIEPRTTDEPFPPPAPPAEPRSVAQAGWEVFVAAAAHVAFTGFMKPGLNGELVVLPIVFATLAACVVQVGQRAFAVQLHPLMSLGTVIAATFAAGVVCGVR